MLGDNVPKGEKKFIWLGKPSKKIKLLKVCDQPILIKEKDDYLGVVQNEGGLSKSVEATVAKRYGRIFSSIIEVSSILEDNRIDTIGEFNSGYKICELAIIPYLLNNADVWIQFDEQTTNQMEDLLKMMFWYVFAVPVSTPTPGRFDYERKKSPKETKFFTPPKISWRGLSCTGSVNNSSKLWLPWSGYWVQGIVKILQITQQNR